MQVDTAQLRKDAEQKFAGAKREYDESLRHIEAVEQIANGRAPAVSATQPKPLRAPISAGLGGKVGIRFVVRLVIRQRPDGFTLSDVENFFKTTYPKQAVTRRQISSTLAKMRTRTKELRLIKEGAGTSPAIYGQAIN